MSTLLDKLLEYQWNNPPTPFNPDYDPDAKQRFADVTASMEFDGYYADHTREECRIEWARRYQIIQSHSLNRRTT